MRKKLLMSALALIMVMSLSVPTAFASVGPVGDPLQDNDKIVDVFINADVDSGIDPEIIKTMLAEKLNGGTKVFSGSTKVLTADDFRINTNVVSIDVSDLSKWIIYDHYGSDAGAVYENGDQTGKVTAPTSWTNVFGPSTVKRPYFAYYEENKSYGDNANVFKISDFLALPSENQTSVAPLDQHIYALKEDAGSYAMTFIGYGSPAYCDYLYYPATSAGTKEVSFTVNSNYVNTHTMSAQYGGAGYLLNTGIDSVTGYISGYVLLFQFNSPSTLSAIRLMKINDNVLADDLHQNGLFHFDSNNWQYNSDYVTEIKAVTGVSWSPIMDVNLELTPTNIKLMLKAAADTDYTSILNESLTSTGYNGFGPFTQYSSHGCEDNTQFRFTKLQMGFAADSTSILDALSKSNFLAGSEKYFVNLLKESGGSTVSNEDWQGVTRLRDGKIRYVTNVDNPFLNDGGVVTSGAPNGSNGKTIKTYADLDALTDKIAAYILQKNSYTTPSGTISLSSPVAMFDLRALNNESVATVVRDFVGSGLPVYTSDASKPSTGATLQTYKYKLTSPGGVVQTLPDRTAPASSSNPLMTVTTSTELGTWTANLTVVDSHENVSSSATATFQVAKAEEYDVAITAGAHMTLTDGNTPVNNSTSPSSAALQRVPSEGTSSQTVTQYTPITDIPVTAEEGYVLPAGYSLGHGLSFVRLTETTGKVTGTPTGDLTATLKDARKASVITCTLGTGTGSTPDMTKYYITVLPSDPGFEYNLIDSKGNVYPTGNSWVSGREEAIVFGPLFLGDTYKVIARPTGSEEFAYEELDSFVLLRPSPDPTPTPDTGDASQLGLLFFLLLGSLTGAVLVCRRKPEESNES